jgi:hypothetical protein
MGKCLSKQRVQSAQACIHLLRLSQQPFNITQHEILMRRIAMASHFMIGGYQDEAEPANQNSPESSCNAGIDQKGSMYSIYEGH